MPDLRPQSLHQVATMDISPSGSQVESGPSFPRPCSLSSTVLWTYHHSPLFSLSPHWPFSLSNASVIPVSRLRRVGLQTLNHPKTLRNRCHTSHLGNIHQPRRSQVDWLPPWGRRSDLHRCRGRGMVYTHSSPGAS